jgi:hypothetical protein
MTNDCPVRSCEWTNGFKTCQDGSREAALHYHMAGAHPAQNRIDACSRCGVALLPIEEGHRLWDQYGDWITRNRAEPLVPSKWGEGHDYYDAPANQHPRRGPGYRMFPSRCETCDAERGQ